MKKIKLYYYNRKPNFGDQLNLPIIENLFNCEGSYSDMSECEMCAIGSILDGFLDRRGLCNRFFHPKLKGSKSPLIVWGSGFIMPPQLKFHNKLGFPEKFKRILDVRAVRGLITLNRLKRIFKCDFSNISLGDPGLLVSLLYERASSQPQYQLGIVPHYHDYNLACFQKIVEKIPDSIIIDVTEEPLSVIETIKRCKYIISSSLHGLIVADSFGIPNQWVVASDSVEGGGYKFEDYYSVYSLNIKPLDLRSANFTLANLNAIADGYQIERFQIDEIQKNLLSSFPSDIFNE